ncbi:hypothetical protein [Rhizobium leguminosarum]|uniref:hypothetical protein n=1 Tax=Rhizobium leguminosarum TaxID=384 RepID=UPI001C922A3A|nr:hypothetical protein [Rhizobium leguminosarum]MBY2989722.1 hypothetical protein [Rhizobium leguminosarum]
MEHDLCDPAQQTAMLMVAGIRSRVSSQLGMTRQLTYSCIPRPISCQLPGTSGYGENGENAGAKPPLPINIIQFSNYCPTGIIVRAANANDIFELPVLYGSTT